MVIRDPATSLPLVRQVRRKVDFPLMLPTMHRAVVLTGPGRCPCARTRSTATRPSASPTGLFADGVYQYWGIQQTDWKDAPVLSEANKKTTIGGREYELHYSGSKLHMVVLRDGGQVPTGS